MLGEHQPVILYITDGGQNTEALRATQEKLVNAGYPLLRDVIANGNVGKVSKDVDIAILSQNFSLDQIAAPICKAVQFLLVLRERLHLEKSQGVTTKVDDSATGELVEVDPIQNCPNQELPVSFKNLKPSKTSEWILRTNLRRLV